MSPEEILAIQQREFAGKYAAATKDFEADRERLTGQYREALVHSQESIAKRDEALKEMSMSQEQFNEQLTCAKSSNALLEEKLVNETSAWERERFELRDSIKEFRRGSEMYENKFSAADAELQILKVQFTELKAAHDSDAKELAELRSAHSKDSVALKASRDGTKGLLEQRDLAKREAAEMGAKAAQLRSQLEASEAAQQDVRDEAASFKTERDSALEGRRQALLTVDKQKMDHQNEMEQLKQNHRQVVQGLQSKYANLQLECDQANSELKQANEAAKGAAALAVAKYDDLHRQLKFSISEVEDLLAQNSQLGKQSTELKLALWSVTGSARGQNLETPKSPEEAQELDQQLIGQARRLNRVYGEKSEGIVPAMGRVTDGNRFNNQDEV